MNTSEIDTPCCSICKASKTVRVYKPVGFVYNPDDNRCNAHVEKHQHKYYIPCVVDTDGIPFGLSAVPKAEAQVFMELPESDPKSYSWHPKYGWTKE